MNLHVNVDADEGDEDDDENEVVDSTARIGESLLLPAPAAAAGTTRPSG